MFGGREPNHTGVPGPPLIVHEDEHLLVVNKPAGWSTHAPGPYAGEGIYDWLRHRKPEWAHLAIIHRLDKETSGVMVFAKTTLANRSLTAQFSGREVRKRYLFLTDRPAPRKPITVRSALVRAGERYVSRPPHAGAALAETRFESLGAKERGTLIAAEPVTGRTHQIRVHAADQGFPVLGDTAYGGSPAPRVFLHSASLTLRHPADGATRTFEAAPDFDADPRWALRARFVEPELTNAFRLVHGAADGWPGWYVDRLGEWLLSQAEGPLGEAQRARLAEWLARLGLRGAYHQTLERRVRQTASARLAPQLILGEAAPGEIVVVENGVRFGLRLGEGYSIGLFLDQRDNRRRLRTNHIAAGFAAWTAPAPTVRALNMFGYTCGFSVCSALAGARVTSVDLSARYLEWGRRNYVLTGLDPGAHEFVVGEAFEWLRRLAKRGRTFDVVLLDPPTFSTSKGGGMFRAEHDFGRLVTAATPLVKAGGVLFAATNAARLEPARFLQQVTDAISARGRVISRQHYAPQPPDFPITRDEPAYLKTVWLRLD